MSAPFSRSLRALGAEGAGASPLVIGVAAALLAAWMGWFGFGRVTVWAVTDAARVEVDGAAHPVSATEAGRVVSAHLGLGREVVEGEVLIELDHALQQHALEEEQAHQQALDVELAALRAELATALGMVGTTRASGAAAVAEAESRVTEADATAHLAEERAARLAQLVGGPQLSELELLQARAAATSARAAADGTRIGLSREGLDRRGAMGDREARVAQLEREVATVSGAVGTSAAVVARLAAAVDRRKVRAPVTGRLGDVSSVAVGAVLAEGDRVATVVPRGALRIVAAFVPSEALGRVRIGQSARLRLDGFPWTWYGTVPAVVTGVADEVRDGVVRVELAPEPAPPSGGASAVPLQHGLPGAVEVAVEEVSPATLVLRAAGGALGPVQRTAR
ncbi:MAG: HlyD family efflux transporter periplasmic adaptor subunit [Pseudomonadota bacterium]|nr:HlyD family efflux transporter periplasmic adaptor subunit [Pseudomonadota bacterium]